MRAAVYARKSTEQIGVADDQRSVFRQIDSARAFIAERGWTLDPQHVFSDDGFSGAEFDSRPAFNAMMSGARRREFDVLVISEDSRLGREQFETGYVLKKLHQARVRVFSCADGQERAIAEPIDKMKMAMTSYADEEERHRARLRTHAAMIRKARQHHVTGGRVFGYRIVSVFAPNSAGGSSQAIYKLREIDEAQAIVVRRIFRMTAEGYGLKAIAKALNADGLPTPRPQQGRPAGWVASSLLAILDRELYRGEIVYNKTKKRDQWGEKKQQPRPESEWIRVPAPELRIVTDDEWQQAQEQRERNRKTFGQRFAGRLQGQVEGERSKCWLVWLVAPSATARFTVGAGATV